MWKYKTNGEVRSSPAIANGVIFCGSQDGNLYAIDKDDGTRKWLHSVYSSIDSSPAVANGVVYFGANNGTIYGLDVESGTELWSYNTGSQKIYSSPAIVDGVLYIASSDGKIYAFTSHADFSNSNLNKKLNSPVGMVTAGDEITYTIKFYNEGLGEATNFKIEDTLGQCSTFTSASGNGTHSNGVVIWDIGTVSPNSGGSVILRVKVGTDTPNDTLISNLAKFTWDIHLTRDTNVVINRVIKEIVMVIKVVNIQEDKVKPGDSLVYTILYKNNGSSTITGINILDKVNQSLTNISPANEGKYQGGTITWQIGSLAPNGNGAITFSSKVTSLLPNGTSIPNNTAVFNSNQISTPVLAIPGTLTVTSPDFSTSVKTVTGIFTPGETITYTINYINTGSLTATGVEIWDEVVDDNLIVDEKSIPPNAYNQNYRTITWSLGGSNSGSVTFKARIKSPLANGTLIKNKVTIKASYMPDFVTNEVVGTVSSTPDFSYSTKEVFPKPGIPLNKILTYTINYKNTGQMDAEDVVVIDRLDPHLSVSTVTSCAEVITGVGTVNLNVQNGWTRFDSGTVNGHITIITSSGSYISSDISEYPQVQNLIAEINGNLTAKVNISYNADTDRFTIHSLEGAIIELRGTGTNHFFTAIKIPTGIYCSGNYSNGTITWDIGQVKVGEGGSVTFKAMVIGTPTNVRNQAEISFFGTTCLTNEVNNIVDITPPPVGLPPIEGSSTTDLDADTDGTYTIYWQVWNDDDSGIAMYGIQERLNNENNWMTLSNDIPGNTEYFEVTNRVKGNTYYYRLRAMNVAGTWSSYSDSSDGIRIVDQLEVVNPATTTIITLYSPLEKGGRRLLLSGQIVVQIPKGAFASTVTFTIRQVSPPATDLNKSSPIISAVLNDSAFELKALKENYYGMEVQPVNPIIVTLPYSDPDTNKEDDDLAYRIYRLAGDHWEIVAGKQTVDATNDLVTADEVKQLSIFAVAAPTIHLQDVIVYPNPFKLRRGDERVKFKNLPAKVSLWIYNIAGELVFNKDITGTDESPYPWPIVNNAGDRVASGVYIYIITNELGEKVTGKVAIIK
ncbi:MAG: PQQ-binding-like beta-propeller repeat protein [Nitrospirota bacterium]